ncbi:kinase activator [Sodiomyces alkalinus F11]|uniref:Autophagy-related protein 17 n=1 Tax=Sodiomyces alkalinus (strain CBS 110278 / VKM F-3762 / F11) TaxID=1314773 RepID=A0A3N2Q229_SODAK|nr:kinase activator [Sodiomyces alkalinus F11]ROT40807.1 kinase activator [Sodiomyces alkalinus F11]
MASSPHHPGSRSVASSTSAGRDSPSQPPYPPYASASASASATDSIPVETLVEYLLAAKRSLSSMQHVLRANDLATGARRSHEQAALLCAQTQFVRRAMVKQMGVLMRIRRGLKRTYDAGKRDFGSVVKTMDTANERLQATMEMLRNTHVEAVFRPAGEEPRNLMDFVDERSVYDMVEALKTCLGELQAIQTSFDGDLLRFDDDLRVLKKFIVSSPLPSSDAASTPHHPIPELFMSLVEHSHSMAELLTSLTQHFDLCVTAVRTTEGGADLARRRAAEVTTTHGGATGGGGGGGAGTGDGGDVVSISGVIADQETHMSNLEPITSQDRADMLSVVVSDAAEVDGVVREIGERLRAAEADFAALEEQTSRVRAVYLGTVKALRALEDVGARLASYVAAEAEFLQRWAYERQNIQDKLIEMDQLRDFYERYAGAYDSLLLEVERRRRVEDKVQHIWRKAKESVDKLVEADRREREGFRQDVGEYVPTDLWPGMGAGMKSWELVLTTQGVAGPDEGEGGVQKSTPALDRRVTDAARDRLGRRQR